MKSLCCCCSSTDTQTYEQIMPPSVSTPSPTEPLPKRKLADALLLLTDRPDGVADISSCALTKIPKNFFQICAVYVKTKIVVCDNQIKDLESGGPIEDGTRVRILEAQRNCLEKLPVNFGVVFPNLLELDLSHNHLKILPTTLAYCRALRKLSLARNYFVEFPSVVCEIRSLMELDVSVNGITSLPLTFHNLGRLETFNYDKEKLVYPPKDVCANGITAILRRISEDDGKEFLPLIDQVEPPVDAHGKRALSVGMLTSYEEEQRRVNGLLGKSPSSQEILQSYRDEEKRMESAISRYANDENSKRKDVLKYHAALEEDDRKHLENIRKVQVKEQDMLMRSLQEREKLESELQRLAFSVEQGNKSLLDALRDMESHSRKLLDQLSAQSKEREKYFKYYEEESRKADLSWRAFLPRFEESRRQSVLSAMKVQLDDEAKFDIMYRELMHIANAQIASVIKMHRDEENFVPEILARKKMEQENIINNMLEDENVQKAMFRQLQMETDAVYSRIMSDLVLLENELATLSLLEQKQTDERSVAVKKTLEDERLQLAKMYKRLMIEKEKREEQLRKIMADMEREAVKHEEHFWLAQYARLMENVPATLFYKKDAVVQMDLDAKTEKGKPSDWAKEKQAQAAQKGKVSETLPQTLHLETTCSICLDRPSTEIFLPCGHICCCKICAENLEECPLCREVIVQKMTLNKAADNDAPAVAS